MTIRRFTLSIIILAALIVGAVDLSHRFAARTTAVLDRAEMIDAGYSFITADRPESDIECRLEVLADWNEIWNSRPGGCRLVDGWHNPNKNGTEVYGKTAVVEFDLADSRPRTFTMQVRAHPAIPEDKKQSVRILVNGRNMGRHEVRRTWHKIRLSIHGEALIAGRNEFVFKFERSIASRKPNSTKRTRSSAAVVNRLSLSTTRGPARATRPGTVVTDIWDEQRQMFIVRESGTLVLPMMVPPESVRLNFEVRHTGASVSTGTVIASAVEDLNGRRRREATATGRSMIDRGGFDLPVREFAGTWVLVTVNVDLSGGELEISPPRIDAAMNDRGRPTPGGTPVTAPVSEPPDIVLITLDAARADRFSFAGHTRETTPFIDALAAESVVFPRAYALAPYTLGSVPTMITGLSFFDHRVVSHNDVLSDTATTLAEALKPAGYRTIAFSETPNNSASKGFDQGYDVFYEVWKEAESPENRRAHFIARRVVDWLEANEDGRPLHLQVHMVPPHGPYDPTSDFDIFSDPSYDGPCDGYYKTLSAIDRRSMTPPPGCMDNLLDLYDGNLRAADDATGEIIRALENRANWENTVVLITSDHGEAFWEHGALTHNSTVYGEMLHVPFVLRLPPSLRDNPVETNRLVTLADIVPTLLGTAGIAATETTSGIDLLAADRAPGDRFMVARTTSSRSHFGLRTLRWSLHLNAAGSGALFDLSADPGELDNRATSEEAIFTGLGRILTRRMAQPAQLEVGEGTAAISRDEKELLEALGYVRD